MRRLIVCCVAIALAGCSPKPNIPSVTRTSVFDGKYEFEVEQVEGTTALKSSRTEEGGKVEELIDYQIGSHQIKVVNGALTFDGKDCGALQQGDKIRFTADGKLYVNGIQRGGP
jgi:hypothetical protein